MPIKPGDPIPDMQVKSVTADGTADASTTELLGEGTVVMFSVPGAFTPTCHLNHLPGFVAQADALRAAGADRIICATANDHHVVKAWAQATDAFDKLSFIADLPASFAEALGIERDLSAGGLGLRYTRAALVFRDGVLDWIAIEASPGEVDASSAAAVLAHLSHKAG